DAMGIMLSETAQERLDGLFEEGAILKDHGARLPGERSPHHLASVDGLLMAAIVLDDDTGAPQQMLHDRGGKHASCPSRRAEARASTVAAHCKRKSRVARVVANRTVRP